MALREQASPARPGTALAGAAAGPGDAAVVWPPGAVPDPPSLVVPSRTKVLVVEDDPDVADLIALHLADAGYTVGTASDGVAALYALDRDLPDLVVLDLNLPRVSGFRLLHLLKQDSATSTVPVLVVTALSFAEAKEVAQAGADDFLTKPFEREDLLGRVQQLLARPAGRSRVASATSRSPAAP